MGNGVVLPFRKETTCNPNGEQNLKYTICSLQENLTQVRQDLQCRENEVNELQKEVHKLKSVLQQANTMLKKEETLFPIQEHSITSSKRQTLQKSFSTTSTTLNKKQGVSAESGEFLGQLCNVKLARIDKDLRSKQLIREAILENDFLKKLDSAQVREIVDVMYPKEYEKDSYVIQEGDHGDQLFVSGFGELEVLNDEEIIGKMGPGEVFGELAVLYNCTRTASVKAKTDCKIWVLERKIFQQIMVRTGIQRLQDNIVFLKSIPLLNKLSNDTLIKIADVFKIEFFPAETYIFEQGMTGDTFFIITSGSVKVTHRTSENLDESDVRILTKGDYFGEQALLKEDIRSKSVLALPPGVECFTLDKNSFIQLIGDLNEWKEKSYEDNQECESGYESIINTSVDSEDGPYSNIKLRDLKVLAILGEGGFGKVKFVQHKNDPTLTFALKCLKKKHVVDTKQQEHVLNEKKILLSSNSSFICKLHRTYRDTRYAYLLLECCLGGEVWTIMKKRRRFDENSARFIVACVVEAFSYLHKNRIIYRDLKPENLMFDEMGYVKLVDFGFAKKVKHGSKTWTFCGTPEYCAPEVILRKGHDRAVDYWALGILIFELLTGNPPFYAADHLKTYTKILKGLDTIYFPRKISRSAQSLIRRLCREVPSERLGYQKGGIGAIKRHRWFFEFNWADLRKRVIQPPIIPVINYPEDVSNFMCLMDEKEIPPEEFSGWDADF